MTSIHKQRVSAICILLLILAASLSTQERDENSARNDCKCGMKKEQLGPLIEEAERGRFTIRRIEIACNTYTRYQTFNKKMAKGFHEGDAFNKKSLEESLANLSNLKIIYPIAIENIEVRLDRSAKDIDLVFCVKQKPNKGF